VSTKSAKRLLVGETMKQASVIGFTVLFVFGSMCPGQTDAAPGNIRLLPGFVHHRVPAIDSGAGTITRADGLVIEYDSSPELVRKKEHGHRQQYERPQRGSNQDFYSHDLG
jgi:hypothetical protein